MKYLPSAGVIGKYILLGIFRDKSLSVFVSRTVLIHWYPNKPPKGGHGWEYTEIRHKSHRFSSGYDVQGPSWSDISRSWCVSDTSQSSSRLDIFTIRILSEESLVIPTRMKYFWVQGNLHIAFASISKLSCFVAKTVVSYNTTDVSTVAPHEAKTPYKWSQKWRALNTTPSWITSSSRVIVMAMFVFETFGWLLVLCRIELGKALFKSWVKANQCHSFTSN